MLRSVYTLHGQNRNAPSGPSFDAENENRLEQSTPGYARIFFLLARDKRPLNFKEMTQTRACSKKVLWFPTRRALYGQRT